MHPSTHSAAAIIAALDLKPIDAEGGWFRRTAVGAQPWPAASGPGPGSAPRRSWSAILALFTPEAFSALHVLSSDEVWCFHAGDPLESLRLHPGGRSEVRRLGPDPLAGDLLHDPVPAGVWQGTGLAPGGRWALVSCLVVPEFEWGDFTLGSAPDLCAGWPAVAPHIRRLCRDHPAAGVR